MDRRESRRRSTRGADVPLPAPAETAASRRRHLAQPQCGGRDAHAAGDDGPASRAAGSLLHSPGGRRDRPNPDGRVYRRLRTFEDDVDDDLGGCVEHHPPLPPAKGRSHHPADDDARAEQGGRLAGLRRDRTRRQPCRCVRQRHAPRGARQGHRRVVAGVRLASATRGSTPASKPRFGQMKVLGPGGFYTLAYTEWGPPRAEHTVVCVHGVSRHGRDFDNLAMALAAAGARVVAPDLPGRGRSEWLGSWAHYSDATYNAAMAALIARLDVECIDRVGTSASGHTGMMVAAEAGTPIRRLVLPGSPPGRCAPSPTTWRESGGSSRSMSWRRTCATRTPRLGHSPTPSGDTSQNTARCATTAAACAFTSTPRSPVASWCLSSWISCFGDCGSASRARCSSFAVSIPISCPPPPRPRCSSAGRRHARVACLPSGCRAADRSEEH